MDHHHPSPHSSASSSSASGQDSAANSPTSATASSPPVPRPRGPPRHGAALHTLADAASQSSPLSSGRHSRHQRQSLHSQQQEASSPGSRTSNSPPLGAIGRTSASSSRKTSFSTSFSAPVTATPTATLGPLTQQIVLPPRKQPGRKRATEEPIDKRTAQNRTAQRAYRERRAQVEEEQRKRLNELENETVPQLNAKIAQYEAQSQRDQERIRSLMDELERERSAAVLGSGIGNKRRSPPKQFPDHDEKRARHDVPSNRSSVTPDAGPSPSSASPYTGNSGYFPDDLRRSSVTLPSVSELSLLSGKGQRAPMGQGGKLPSLSEYSMSSAPPSSSGLYRTAHNSHYQSISSQPAISELQITATSSNAEASHASAVGGSKLHLGLPPPMSLSSSSGSPVSTSSSLPSLYSTSSSIHAAVTATSPSSHSDVSSPPGSVAVAATTHRFPAAMQKLALRNPATDGCGNCEEGGSCPCVDTLVNVEGDDESEGSGDILYTEIKG